MKLYLSLFLTIFFAGCTSLLNKSTIEVPKLSEKNRLLGALLPERICYDVQHYDINIDIDVDNKYLKGYVDFDAIAVNDFNLLQIDLAKSMKLNNVEYKTPIRAFTSDVLDCISSPKTLTRPSVGF